MPFLVNSKQTFESDRGGCVCVCVFGDLPILKHVILIANTDFNKNGNWCSVKKRL